MIAYEAFHFTRIGTFSEAPTAPPAILTVIKSTSLNWRPTRRSTPIPYEGR